MVGTGKYINNGVWHGFDLALLILGAIKTLLSAVDLLTTLETL
jgi:hypothetical protein